MSFKLASELFGKSSPASGKTIEDDWGHCPLSLSLSLSLSLVECPRVDLIPATSQLNYCQLRATLFVTLFACPCLPARCQTPNEILDSANWKMVCFVKDLVLASWVTSPSPID